MSIATDWKSGQPGRGSWDVSRFFFESAEVQIVDEGAGDRRHINVDQILQTDEPVLELRPPHPPVRWPMTTITYFGDGALTTLGDRQSPGSDYSHSNQ